MPTQPYTVKGKTVPSVTTVIGKYFPEGADGLMMWAAGFGSKEEFKKKRYLSAETGTQTHQWIQDALTGATTLSASKVSPEQTEQAAKCYEGFLLYYNVYLSKAKAIETEIGLTHSTLEYGGTCDLLWQDTNDEWHVADFKTGKLKVAAAVQLAAYAEAIEHLRGIKVSHLEVIALGDNEYSVNRVEDRSLAFTIFTSLLLVARCYNGLMLKQTKKEKNNGY